MNRSHEASFRSCIPHPNDVELARSVRPHRHTTLLRSMRDYHNRQAVVLSCGAGSPSLHITMQGL